MELLWRGTVVIIFLIFIIKEVRCYIHSSPALLSRATGQSVLLSVGLLVPLEQVELQGTWSHTPPSSRDTRTPPSPSRGSRTLVSFTKESVIVDLLHRRRLRLLRPLSLQIHNLSLADEGFYLLQVNLEFLNHTGHVLRVERTMEVTVDEPASTPVVQRTPGHMIIEDQVNVTLSCQVQRGTRLSFSWLKDGVRLRPSPRLSRDNSSLALNPVRSQDRGLYRCEVSNAISRRSSEEAQLNVFYGPYDLSVRSAHGLRTGQVFTISPGREVHFECQADSNPPNTCEWISRNHNSSRVIAQGPRLKLESHSLLQAQEFLCRAFNNVTHKQQEAHFTLVLRTDWERQSQDGFRSSPLTVLTVLSLLGLASLLLLLLWRRCRPTRVIMCIHQRSYPEHNRQHCSGHEDAAGDFGVYEFLSLPSRAEPGQFSSRSVPNQDPHSTIYEVIQHIPDRP